MLSGTASAALPSSLLFCSTAVLSSGTAAGAAPCGTGTVSSGPKVVFLKVLRHGGFFRIA